MPHHPNRTPINVERSFGMSKRKRGRTTKAQVSSKVRPQAARGGEHTTRANSKQAQEGTGTL